MLFWIASALLFNGYGVQIYVIDILCFFPNNNYKVKYAYNMKSSLLKKNILCIFYMGKCKLRAKSCSASGRKWMCLISYAVCSCARQIKVISCCWHLKSQL